MKAQKTFGKWKVEPNGEMNYDDGRYVIFGSDLEQDDWILHLTSKGWIDWNDFIPAYLQALRNAGIQKLSILAYYE